MRDDPYITELTSGSGLFMPTLFDSYDAFESTPAAFYALSVVRKPAPNIATLFSGGYAASGAAGKSRLPTPTWPEGLSVIGTEFYAMQRLAGIIPRKNLPRLIEAFVGELLHGQLALAQAQPRLGVGADDDVGLAFGRTLAHARAVGGAAHLPGVADVSQPHVIGGVEARRSAEVALGKGAKELLGRERDMEEEPDPRVGQASPEEAMAQAQRPANRYRPVDRPDGHL